MELNKKTVILSILATMIIGGALAFFTVNPFAYNGNSLEEEITIGLNTIKNQN